MYGRLQSSQGSYIQNYVGQQQEHSTALQWGLQTLDMELLASPVHFWPKGPPEWAMPQTEGVTTRRSEANFHGSLQPALASPSHWRSGAAAGKNTVNSLRPYQEQTLLVSCVLLVSF